MPTPVIKNHLRLLFIGNFALFVLNKTVIRPWVWSHDLPEALNIFVGSYPNFAEAVLGLIILTGIFAEIHRHFFDFVENQPALATRLLAFVFGGIYVITQELKMHNLGGNNIYDPHDLMASIIGLSFTFAFIHQIGFYQK